MHTNLLTVNILDLIQTYGEPTMRAKLSDFSCPKNPKVETFLKRDSIDFARQKKSITYLVYNSNSEIVGFFTLTHKAVILDASCLSKTQNRKMTRYAELNPHNNSYNISAFLLAQFAKNFHLADNTAVNGNRLMRCVFSILKSVQQQIGGGMVYLDCENNPDMKTDGLERFYQNEGFVPFGVRQSESDETRYLQLLKFF